MFYSISHYWSCPFSVRQNIQTKVFLVKNSEIWFTIVFHGQKISWPKTTPSPRRVASFCAAARHRRTVTIPVIINGVDIIMLNKFGIQFHF